MGLSRKEAIEDLDIQNFNLDFNNYDRLTAVYCAQLSILAYSSHATLLKFHKEYCIKYPEIKTNFQFINEKKSHTQVLLWCNKDFLVISFRGTEPKKLKDWWTDLKFKTYKNKSNYDEKLKFLPPGSAGFRKALINLFKKNDFYTEIDQIIKESSPSSNIKEFPIYLTGHSLGAALSQLFMYSLKRCGYYFSGAYHLAPPLAVSKSINHYMKDNFGEIVYDIVNHKDYVPRAGRIGVQHFGKFYRIHQDGLIYKEKEKYIKFKKNEYLKELQLHSKTNYLKFIKDEHNTLEKINQRSENL